MTDSDLISLLKKGDDNAFSIIYNRYWGKVCNFSRLYITSDADVEDIVQQVFLKLWNYRESLKENESFATLINKMKYFRYRGVDGNQDRYGVKYMP